MGIPEVPPCPSRPQNVSRRRLIGRKPLYHEEVRSASLQRTVRSSPKTTASTWFFSYFPMAAPLSAPLASRGTTARSPPDSRSLRRGRPHPARLEDNWPDPLRFLGGRIGGSPLDRSNGCVGGCGGRNRPAAGSRHAPAGESRRVGFPRRGFRRLRAGRRPWTVFFPGFFGPRAARRGGGRGKYSGDLFAGLGGARNGPFEGPRGASVARSPPEAPLRREKKGGGGGGRMMRACACACACAQ